MASADRRTASQQMCRTAAGGWLRRMPLVKEVVEVRWCGGVADTLPGSGARTECVHLLHRSQSWRAAGRRAGTVIASVLAAQDFGQIGQLIGFVEEGEFLAQVLVRRQRRERMT